MYNVISIILSLFLILLVVKEFLHPYEWGKGFGYILFLSIIVLSVGVVSLLKKDENIRRSKLGLLVLLVAVIITILYIANLTRVALTV